MKSFIVGLLTIIFLGIVGFYTFKATTNFMNQLSPSPSSSAIALASADPSSTPTPTPKPITTPIPSYRPTTKTTTTTTTTTTSHLLLTLIKTSACQTYVTEIKDINGPLTLKYSLKDGYKASVTAWKNNGEEVISQREISGSGELMRIEGLSYLKLQAQPTSCSSTSDTWITLTAER